MDRHRRHLAVRRLRLQPRGRAHRPEGEKGGHRSAVKVWDRREFRNLDDTVELGTRNIKVALKRLRKFVREGAEDELDLPGTIRSTANNAGYLDIQMVPERHNAVKCCCFSTSAARWTTTSAICEELFSAARTEFRHLEYFYFHDCLMRGVEGIAAPPGEHRNGIGRPHIRARLQGDVRRRRQHEPLRDRPGGRQRRALERQGRRAYGCIACSTPTPRRSGSTRYRRNTRSGTTSIGMIRALMEGRMFPLTLDGIDRAMRELTH